MSGSFFSAVDAWEPRVKALVHWDRSSAPRRSGQVHAAGPLSGWAVGVKDIIDVAGWPTRCGVDFTSVAPASRNAAIVDLLEAAGAWMLGKTVTTAFAYVDPGPTCNPWNVGHTPGGSSSGSAAAVACGMVRLALGTQTIGSILRPASFCGVVGFKPTYDCLPTRGVFALSPSVDTVGFFTADVADMQQAFSAVTDQGPQAAPTAPLRIAVVPDLLCQPADGEMLARVNHVAQLLEVAGHDVRPLVLPGVCAAAYEHHAMLVAREVAQVHHELFSEHADAYPLRLRQIILNGQQLDDEAIDPVHRHRAATTAAFGLLLADYNLVLMPAAPGPAPRGLETTGDPRIDLLATYTGLPAIALPAGLSDAGLPLGVQLLGAGGADASLLAAARVVEEVIGFDGKPGF